MDSATVTQKLRELVAERGARQQAGSSMVLGQPVGNARFVVYGLMFSPQEMQQSIVAMTEVEVVPYSKGLTRLRARTLNPIVSSLPASNPARESEALRLCADYLERGIKPVRQQVLPYDLWQQQIRTNELNQLPQRGVPPADVAKPELKLK